jgi:hypothetical protein
MMHTERRREARLEVSQPVKVQCLETGRYLAGRTRNLSTGGALLEVLHPSLLVPGQRLRVGVARNERQAILASRDMAEAIVVRSLGLGGSQNVAVCFAQPQQLAAVG